MSKFYTDSPYRHDVFTVKQYGEHNVKISYIKSLREAGWEDEREHKAKASVNDKKLSNNLARAKAKVKEYALCNSWDWWVTLTVDPVKYDRYNLDEFYKKFSQYIRNYNKRHEEPIQYVLVPEMHEDDAWHLHGFIKGIPQSEIYTNQYGYLSWSGYDKRFGFMSMSAVKDLDKASSYILKYMTKCVDKNVGELNKHLYYCSKGLMTAEEIYKGAAEFKGEYDWEHPDGYCKTKTIDLRHESIWDYLEVEQNDDTTEF